MYLAKQHLVKLLCKKISRLSNCSRLICTMYGFHLELGITGFTPPFFSGLAGEVGFLSAAFFAGAVLVAGLGAFFVGI